MIEAGQPARDPFPDLIRTGYVVEAVPVPSSIKAWIVLLVIYGVPIFLRRNFGEWNGWAGCGKFSI